MLRIVKCYDCKKKMPIDLVMTSPIIRKGENFICQKCFEKRVLEYQKLRGEKNEVKPIKWERTY